MVPSWTETLIEAGADVVGRTRFCIHPRERVKAIPAIGGTKDWNIEKVRALKADLIVLDREENTREMGGLQEFPLIVTHVQSVMDMPVELKKLASQTGLKKLDEMSERFDAILKPKLSPMDLADFPAVKEWIRPIQENQQINTIVYMIWKNPWMAVSQQTFIGSMLERFAGPGKVLVTEAAYPKIIFENLNEDSTLLLFSTEPFPFAKHTPEIRHLRFASAIVDGEKWSWFGIRSLRFLESFLAL